MEAACGRRVLAVREAKFFVRRVRHAARPAAAFACAAGAGSGALCADARRGAGVRGRAGAARGRMSRRPARFHLFLSLKILAVLSALDISNIL